jgi:metal-dependent amidase/aminoacylase/carboxypeptidase family protein
VPFAARNGHMHACGHDVHLAALAALGCAARRVELPVALLAVLQPREETYPSGARDLVDSGAFEPHHVGAFVAVHVQPAVPAGAVTAVPGRSTRPRTSSRSSSPGRGGHGEPPHSCGSDDFSFYRRLAPTLMLFLRPHTDGGARLHSAEFLPSDETVGAVAEAMLTGYLGAIDAIG